MTMSLKFTVFFEGFPKEKKGSDFTTLGKKKRCIFDKKKGTDTDLTNSHSIGCYLQ